MTNASRFTRRRVALALVLLIARRTVHGESLSGHDLLVALRAGGYVILMRHASSPGRPPDTAQLDLSTMSAAARANCRFMNLVKSI